MPKTASGGRFSQKKLQAEQYASDEDGADGRRFDQVDQVLARSASVHRASVFFCLQSALYS